MTVKLFMSTDTGAPALTNTAGSLQAVLRACLVTGYAVAAITSLAVSAGVATATFASAHPYAADRLVRVAGATGGDAALINGDQRVLSATTNTITFAVPGAADGAVSGSIEARIAPLGWQETYASGNVSVFKPTVVEATGMLLRVDDSGTTHARVRGYESMTDANTGMGLIPTEVQIAGGLYWPKSSNATVKPWLIVADERGFYFCVAPGVVNGVYTIFYAGDIISLLPGDSWAYMVTGNANATIGSSAPEGCCGYSHVNENAIIARNYTGIGGPIWQRRRCEGNSSYYGSSANSFFGAYPNRVNNGLLFSRVQVGSNNAALRGFLPGLMPPVQDCAGSFSHGQIVDGTNDYAGRRFIAVRTGPPQYGQDQLGSGGISFFDLNDWGR